MILQRALAASGDEDDLLDPRLQCLFDGVLDEGLVDDGQHLLWHSLGSRQEAGAQTRDREDGFTQRFDRHFTQSPVLGPAA